jgi:hypothetical protein
MQFYQEPQVKGSLQDALSTGLNQLMHLKLGQMQQRHQQKQAIPGLQALGIPQDTAEQLSKLSPELQSVVIKNYLQGAENTGLGEALGGIAGQGQPVIQQEMSGVPAEQATQLPQQQLAMQQAQQGPKSFADVLKNPRLKPEHKLRIAEMQQRKELAEKKAQQLAKQAEEKTTAGKFKETKEFRKATIENAKASRDRLHDLERMEQLETTGKLDTPGYLEFLKRTGLDVSTLKSPESQEFEKLSAGFMRDAKSIFGARISNFEIEQFLKAIPSMSQSPEGRKRVIANLKRVARASVEHANAMKEVIGKHKGVPPYDLMEKVDSMVEKKMDALSKMFKKDLERPVPAAENRAMTMIPSVLGSILGAPGAIIGKLGNIGGGLIGGGMV